MLYVYDYPRPGVSCEAVIFDLYENIPQVLLGRRKNEPFQGMWSIPGGFIKMDEELEECAARELWEETGVDISPDDLQQTFTKGKPERDPRGRIITVVYTTVIDRTEYELCAGDDIEEVQWFKLNDLPSLAADHLETIRKILGEVHHYDRG